MPEGPSTRFAQKSNAFGLPMVLNIQLHNANGINLQFNQGKLPLFKSHSISSVSHCCRSASNVKQRRRIFQRYHEFKSFHSLIKRLCGMPQR